MNNDKDLSNDPLFKDLRKFAAKQEGPETMPAELFEAFRSAGKTKSRSKWIGRTVIGLILTSVALPSLSYAHVLPTPVANVVKRVVHVVSAPVRVVASVVVSEPAPTTDLTQATQTPAPEPAAPAVVPTPVPVPTKQEGEKKVALPSSPKKNSSENHESSKSESKSESKNESSKSESDDEGGAAPKIPASGTSAPKVSGSGESKSESKSSSSKNNDD